MKMNYYQAALAITEKATRHFAIDSSPKHARSVQRAFCGTVNRVAKLLSRDFPGAEITVAFARERRDSSELAVEILAVESDRIIRSVRLWSLGKDAVLISRSRIAKGGEVGHYHDEPRHVLRSHAGMIARRVQKFPFAA